MLEGFSFRSSIVAPFDGSSQFCLRDDQLADVKFYDANVASKPFNGPLHIVLMAPLGDVLNALC